MSTASTRAKFLGAIFAIALLLRIAWIVTLGDKLVWPDEQEFGAIAEQLVAGNGYVSNSYRANPVVPVYLAARDHAVVITPSRVALQRSLQASKGGRSVTGDSAYSEGLARMPRSSTFVAMASAGRCAEMASRFMSEQEREQMMPVAQVIGDTVMTIGIEHSSTRLSVHTHVGNLPNVSPRCWQAATFISLRSSGVSPARQCLPSCTRSWRPVGRCSPRSTRAPRFPGSWPSTDAAARSNPRISMPSQRGWPP